VKQAQWDRLQPVKTGKARPSLPAQKKLLSKLAELGACPRIRLTSDFSLAL